MSPNLVRVIGTLVQFGRKWNVYPHNNIRMELVLRMPNTTESSSCWCQTFGAFWLIRRGWQANAAPAAYYAERIQRKLGDVPHPRRGKTIIEYQINPTSDLFGINLRHNNGDILT